VADVWYPGADRSKPAWTDGGSILGGKPKLLWHDTETTGLPSYSSGSFPHFTVDPRTGKVWQHIPVNRAARALKNLDGGCQTNRWRVIQVEIIGYVNKVPYHAALGKLAAWCRTEHGVPATCGVKLLPYDDSYGQTSVRLSCSQWEGYTGHLYHMSAPENSHGDPGKPFPIDQILAAAGGGGEELPVDQADFNKLMTNWAKSSDGQLYLTKAAEKGSTNTIRMATDPDPSGDRPASVWFDGMRADQTTILNNTKPRIGGAEAASATEAPAEGEAPA
jgi:hypothetical protein